MTEKKTVSIRDFDMSIWLAARVVALQKGLTMKDFVTQLLEREIKRAERRK